MKQIVKGVLALTLTLLLNACGGDNDSNSSSTPNDQETDDDTRVDFVINAGVSDIVKTGDNLYRVTIFDVPNTMLAFTEPPDHKAYEVQTAGLKLWQVMYRSGPPNAVLTGLTKDGEAFSTVIKMNQPTYDATANTLSFDGSLNGEAPIPPESIEFTNLMIDPTFWQWAKIVWRCTGTVLEWIGAVIQGGIDPLADLAAIAGTYECEEAIRNADWHHK